MNKLHIIYLIIFGCSPVFTFDNIRTLKSISVTFRHGDRTPTPYPSGFYPTDPYKNNPMEPMGHGGLTNEGKKREHQSGVKLRERYNTFLNDIYKPEDIFVISTDFERTKMSLLLLLAGLYPPKEEQLWLDDLDWQPIPINSVPTTLEGIVNPDKCPKFLMELENVKASNEYKKDVSVFNELMRNLTTLTGRETTDTRTILNLFHTLTAESVMNLELPKWTKPYFPDGLIKDATLFEYQTLSYTTKLRKLNGGVQIRKILNHILSGNNGNTKKIHLYSAHETTIAALLFALNLWQNAVPECGSAFIVELHQLDGKNFLKFVYYNSIPPTFETRIIPGCSEYCPIEDFLNIFKGVIPDDAFETCYGPPDNSVLIPKSENPTEWIYGEIRKWYNV